MLGIISIFSVQKLKQCLTFEVKMPNVETRKVLEESAKGKNVEKFDSIDDLFDDLYP